MSANRPRVVAWPLFVARIAVVAVFAIMIVITFLQVVFRYVLTAPLPLVGGSGPVLLRMDRVFWGAALGLERGVHLGVDLLVNRMPPGMRRNTAVASNICIAGFALIIIYASAPVLQLNAWQHSPALGIQMSYVYRGHTGFDGADRSDCAPARRASAAKCADVSECGRRC